VSPRDLRALAAGAGVVALALLVFRVVPRTIGTTIRLRERAQAKAILLVEARTSLTQEPRLEDSAATLRTRLDGLATAVLSGRSESEAWGSLSGRLNLAGSHHGAVVREAVLVTDSTAVERLHRVSGRVSLESDLRGLVATLRALEGDSVALEVSALRVVAPDPTSSPRTPELLRVELTVRGWFLANRPVPPATRGPGR
jgi:hypothetical protein